MFKFLIGIVLGVFICAYYPDVVHLDKYKFLEPGVARDTVVDTLKEFK